MVTPEKAISEEFDYAEYEDIRKKLQMRGQDRMAVQRELAAFCGQRIGQTLSINSVAEVYKDRVTGEVKPYDEPVDLDDETVTIIEADERGLIVSREIDLDRQPALE